MQAPPSTQQTLSSFDRTKVLSISLCWDVARKPISFFRLLLMMTLFIGTGFKSYTQNQTPDSDSIVVEQDIFNSKVPLVCSLTFDMRKFIKTKLEGKKIPATLSYQKSDSAIITREIYIEARGQSRKEFCYFPPIKLKLKKIGFDYF